MRKEHSCICIKNGAFRATYAYPYKLLTIRTFMLSFLRAFQDRIRRDGSIINLQDAHLKCPVKRYQPRRQSRLQMDVESLSVL